MIVDIEKQGKKYKALVPDGAPKKTWQYGIIIGPPDLSELGLPPSIEVRLHNELFVRGLIAKRDISNSKSGELQAALMAALKVDAQLIAQLYEEKHG